MRAQLAKLGVPAGNPSVIPAKNENNDGKEPNEAMEEKATKLKRQLEDNSQKAKKTLGKRSDEEMQTLFKDVEEAVERYATTHNLDLVLHYNDALTKEDYYSSQNVARKMNLGSLMPVYMASGIDISTDILTDLNQHNPGGK